MLFTEAGLVILKIIYIYSRIEQISIYIVKNRGKREKDQRLEMGYMVQSRKWCKRHGTAEVCDLTKDPQTPALEPLASMTQKSNR